MRDARDDILVYGGLSVVTTAYAVVLEREAKKRKWEPDFTWTEVAVGNALCLAAAAIRERLAPGDGRQYERRVFRAFVWGGLPIIVWQLWQMQRRYRDTITASLHTYTSQMEQTANEPPATPLASARREPPPGS